MNSWTAMSATAKTTSIFAALPLNFAARAGEFNNSVLLAYAVPLDE
jgi:hypothetical protein